MGGLRYVVVSEGTRKTTCDCESSVVFPLNVFWLLSWNRGVSNFVYWKFHYIYCLVIGLFKVTGLFVPLHFRSRERKNHRENFRSRGTFVPWNIRSRGAKSPRTFVPWNFRSCRTFAPQERMFQELSPCNFRTLGTFAPQTTFVPFNFRSCGLLNAFAPALQSDCIADRSVAENYLRLVINARRLL